MHQLGQTLLKESDNYSKNNQLSVYRNYVHIFDFGKRHFKHLEHTILWLENYSNNYSP